MRNTLIFIGCILLANTAIAGFLSLIGFGGSFGDNFIYSQCIGLCIAVLCRLVLRLTADKRPRLVGVMVAIPAGALLGQYLGHLLTQRGLDWSQPMTLQSLFLGLFFGGIASVYYHLRERNMLLASELQARERQRLEAEKRSVEAQLKMLQAQIEPHFLFNSLANVAALIESDSRQAGHLLDALIRYLRASLARTRAEHGTLGDEVALLTAYLEILKIRMGERLDYAFDIPAELLDRPFPPMLLQPIVENAIIHGLEPKPGKGRVEIKGERLGDRLRLSVTDDGVGFAGEAGSGIGLANVRARLDAIFGRASRFELRENENGGVNAALEIPADPPATKA